MNLKLGTLEVVLIALQEILKEKIPVVTRFFVKKQISTIESEFVHYTENRIELCKKYCLRSAEDDQPIIENGHYQFNDLFRPEFEKELQELNDIEVSFNVEPLTVKQLEGILVGPAADVLIEFGVITE